MRWGSDIDYISNIVPTLSHNGDDAGCERKREVKDEYIFFLLSNQKAQMVTGLGGEDDRLGVF